LRPKSSDLLPKSHLSVVAEPDEVKYLIADVDTDDRQCVGLASIFGFVAASPADRC
jgi:hypothetical protein